MNDLAPEKSLMKSISESMIQALRDMAATKTMDMKSGPDALRTAAKAFEEALEVTTL